MKLKIAVPKKTAPKIIVSIVFIIILVTFLIVSGLVKLPAKQVSSNFLKSAEELKIVDTGISGDLDIANFISLKAGSSAPDFNLPTIDGKTISLSDSLKQNKSVVIISFTPGCPSCIAVMGSMKSSYPKYKDKVIFIAVDLSNLGHTSLDFYMQQLKKYIDSLRNDGTIGPYGNFALADTQTIKDYGMVSTEIAYFIDSNGVVRQVLSAPIDSVVWEQVFSKLSQV